MFLPQSEAGRVMDIVWAIIVGFFAGVIAKLVTPGGPKPRGFILTTVLGIVGAVLATFLGQAVHLYGPGDNFDLNNSHVLPALLRKVHEAKMAGAPEVMVWGSGTPKREFLHVDDLAGACRFLLENYDSPEVINVGFGEDVTIRELAELICEVVGFGGKLSFDASKPDGTPRKLLDSSRLLGLGWKPRIPLREGIRGTYEWYLKR